jgi:predicted small lipoprotein YifL
MANRRAATAALILLTLGACGDKGSPKNAPRSSNAAQPAVPAVPSPVEAFVKSHAPKAEVRLINSAEQFSTRATTTSGDAGGQVNDRMAESWRESVLGAINFTGWVAYIDRTEDNGRIYLKLTDNMFLWTDIPIQSPLMTAIRAHRPGHQVVYMTGKIASDDAAGLKGALDGKSPTCFEAASGPQGCHVELTDLRPLAVVD